MKKNISRLLFVAVLLVLGSTACQKMTNQYFHQGSTSNLSVSSSSIAPATADSLSNVLVLKWTNPNYSTDSATVLYTIQIDSAGRNFAKATTWQVTGTLLDSISAKTLNTIAMAYGFSYNTAYNMDIRIISSYANNNEQLPSNTVTISYTPYVIPPKVPVPSNLYLVGDAVNVAPGTAWNTPVDTPYQEFTQVDSVTFSGIFNITGGNSYLLLPVANSFNNKYAIADNTVAGADTTGSFQAYTTGGANFPAPPTNGWYQITVNFQTGTYTVKPYTGSPLPLAVTPNPSTLATGLWIIGDATPQSPSWTNTVPALAGQQFTQLSNADFQITIALSASGGYVFLPAAGDWTNKYGGTSATGGQLLYDNAVPGSNTPAPAVSGNYLINVNFATGKYSVTPK
jgi:hypothetical protein